MTKEIKHKNGDLLRISDLGDRLFIEVVIDNCGNEWCIDKQEIN